MITIGIDPHKRTHTALDDATHRPVATMQIRSTLDGYRELLRWAKRFPTRRWAVENARGLGRHLAQWLVARGEPALDVPSTATARVRELSRGGRRKTDVIDAAAAASVAALHGDASAVPQEDLSTVLSMLEERRTNLADGEPADGGLLDRDADRGGFAFVAQVGQGGQVRRGQGERWQDVMVTDAGGVVLTALSHLGGPQWPAVGGGDDLDIAARVVMFSGPPQVHPGGGAGRGHPVGFDRGAVEVDVAVPGGIGGQQRPVQARPAFGEGVDAFVQVPARNQRSTSTAWRPHATATSSIEGGRGAAAVADTFSSRARAAQPAFINGAAGAVWAPGGQPRVVFTFTITRGTITAIELFADPERLRDLDLAILDL